MTTSAPTSPTLSAAFEKMMNPDPHQYARFRAGFQTPALTDDMERVMDAVDEIEVTAGGTAPCLLLRPNHPGLPRPMLVDVQAGRTKFRSYVLFADQGLGDKLLAKRDFREVYFACEVGSRQLFQAVVMRETTPAIGVLIDREVEYARKCHKVSGVLQTLCIAECVGVNSRVRAVCMIQPHYPANVSQLVPLARELPTEDAWDIALQVLKAVKGLHERGIIHRDLRPVNIALRLGKGGRFQVGLQGFSCAADKGDAAAAREVRGETSYLPAEAHLVATMPSLGPIANGEPLDLWYVGIFLYQMLTGERGLWEPVTSSVGHIRQSSVSASVSPATKQFWDSVRDRLLLKNGYKPYHPLSDMLARLLSTDPADRPSATQSIEALQSSCPIIMVNLQL